MCFIKAALRLFIYVLMTTELFAQSPEVRWEPELSFTWKPAGRWSYNATLSGRNIWKQNGDRFSNSYEWAHLEIRLFATYELFGGNSLGGGYQFRQTDPFDEDLGFEHRLMQQYAFVTFAEARRVGHRIRSEQRIRQRGNIQRFRYRLSYDFPLQGQQLDPGEPYMILSNEVLWSIARNLSELDNRVYVGIGWALSRKRKLETGIQFRVEALNTNEPENIFQLITSFFINR